MFSQSHLESLIANGEFDGGVEYCYSAIAADEDTHFWKAQLGYVCFLDEEHIDRRYELSFKVLRELIVEYPNDPIAYFWLGYAELIFYNNLADARQNFQMTLAIDPQYPYANLVIASYGNRNEKISSLQSVLEQQPFNYRALVALADALIEANQHTQAIATLNKILHNEPFYEKGYGIMNQYINDVLTSANHKDKIRRQAEDKLATISTH